MKRHTRIKLIGPVAFISVLVACKGGGDMSDPAMQEALAPKQCEAAEAEDADGQSSTQDRDPNGPRALVGGALQKVCLNDDQRTAIERIGDHVSAAEDNVADARAALRTALLDGLKGGKIDDAAIGEKVDALVAAREKASVVLREGVEDLHGEIDRGQRAGLVEAIAARMRELEDGSKGWLDTLAKDLSLSGDQRQKIDELVAKGRPELDEERDRAKKAFDAFKEEDFSVERITPIRDVGARMRDRAQRMVAVAKDLGGILTPDQRTKLVEKITGQVSEDRPTPESAVNPVSPGVASGLGQTRQAIVVGRGRVGGYRVGGVGGWGGRRVVVAGGAYVPPPTVVVTPSPYVVGYPLVPGYGPGVW